MGNKPGFRGNMEAVCQETGVWSVHGQCVEVTCGPPPQDIPHAKPVVDPKQGGNVSTGMIVRYQCERMYNGTPTATCGDDGMYITEGRCRKECGPPPLLLRASPSFDNTMVSTGWVAGMRVPYTCDPGFEGYVTALCGEDGNYTATGHCSIAPSVERENLHRNVQALEATIGIENSVLFALLVLWCWRRRWSAASRSPTLLSHAPQQELAEGSASQYGMSDACPIDDAAVSQYGARGSCPFDDAMPEPKALGV